ncbi:MAG: hypothetical protein FDW93_00685 [Bergeyella sp.]|nr:hypothetical protein [Bergeyella sp.]
MECYPNLSAEWLLTGKGEVIKKEEKSNRSSDSSFEKLSIEEKLNALMNLVVENKKKTEDLKETNKRMIEDFRKENRDNQQEIYDSVTTIETRQSIDNSFIVGIIKSTLFREMEERKKSGTHE